MVKKNNYGFYEVIDKPCESELKNYYNQKYYQEERSTYRSSYSTDEIKYIFNKIEQKYNAFKNFLPAKEKLNLLDIGSGEGFCIKYFKDKNWNVTGCDYSDFGIKAHNPDYVNDILVGDIYTHLKNLAGKSMHFDVLWLDNVLEHVLEPLQLLKICKSLSYNTSILIIEVPNDFSLLQEKLYEQKMINNKFWIAVPDHISYFNKDGLINICREAGWNKKTVLSDFPIDFNLANPDANYAKDRSKGRGAHQQRVFLDNMFHEISIENTNKLYEVFAEMGLGRQIIGIFEAQDI
jgi:2-polyprenyl-3-methyl-5-hydroxy-6-metoxy-1,4-benzoquinol methylase